MLEDPPADDGWRVMVEGHSAPFGSEAGREEISRGRAERVAEYLATHGWPSSIPLDVVWRGAEQPVTLDPESQYLNRRVEITAVPDGARERR